MDNKKISPHTVLKNHGGTEDKDFAKMINEDRDQDEVDIIRFSPYYLPSCLPSDLISKEKFLGYWAWTHKASLQNSRGL